MRAWLLSSILALGPAAGGPSRIELDVSRLEQHMSDAALQRFHDELRLRLIEAGHDVGSEGDVRLSLVSAGDTIVVACEIADRRESIEVDDADAAILSLELVHRAVDLVERCTAVAPGSGAEIVSDNDTSLEMDEAIEEPEPSTPAEPQPDPEPEPHLGRAPAPRWGLSANAAAGVTVRLPGVGATVSADLGALHNSGVLLGVLGTISPSRAEQLRVIDALALASVGFRARVSERVLLRPSVGVGVAIHRYAFAEEPVGHRIDFAIRVPLELQLRLTSHIYLSLAIAGTARARRIEHRVSDTPVWTHGVLALDVLAGLRFDWPARRD